MGIDSLLVVTWLAGDVELDTGFRGDGVDDYPQWIEALQETRNDIKGGA
jgi:hypothetical protein